MAMELNIFKFIASCLVLIGIITFQVGGEEDGSNKIKLRGVGASFPKTVYDDWISMFRDRRRKAGVNLEMWYDSQGSSHGKNAIMDENSNVEYAGSDVELTPKEHEEHLDVTTLPTMAGPVVFGYNLDNISEKTTLTLSMETAIGIYNGTITSWDDAALGALNPNLTLPRKKILVIARSDDSGTTHTVTSAFSQYPPWNRTYGAFFSKEGWNNNTIKYYGSTTPGITGVILSFKYSIGYLGWADASEGGVTYARLRNWQGHTVDPTMRSVQLAMEQAAKEMDHVLTVQLASHQSEDSYPIASFTYMLVRMNEAGNCRSIRELSRYIYWFMTDDDAIRACKDKKMVPVSTSIANRVEQLVLQKLTCNGEEFWETVKAEIQAEMKSSENPLLLAGIVCATVFATLFLGIAGYFIIRQIRKNRELDKDEWDVPIEDIVFYTTAKSATGDKARFVMWGSVKSLTDVAEIEEGFQMVQHILQWPGKWNGLSVGLRLLEIKKMVKLSRPTKKLLLWMRDEIIQNNVLNFYGLAELQGERYAVSDYCSKGPLSDLLNDKKLTFNKDCKFSLALDIINGLAFLHSKGIIHGNIRTTNCLVDFKWMVKIADWEYCHLFSHLYPKRNPLLPLRKSPDEVGKDAAAILDLWTAPELIKTDDPIYPNAPCDIYSYAIILQEIFTRKDAYAQYMDILSPNEVLKAVISNNLRPSHDEDTPTRVRQILEYGWSETPSIRPTCEQIQKMLKQAHSFKKSVLDNMVEASEEYINSLEERLQENRARLEVSESKLAVVVDTLVPPFLQKKVLESSRPSDIDITSTASVVMIKVVFEPRHQKRKHSFAKLMDRIDHRLTCIVKHYDAFKIDYTSGVYVLIYGAGSREKRKAIQAARMAYDIITEDEIDIDNSLKAFKVSYQCAIHHGSIYTGFVKHRFTPKSYIMGRAIEETYRLLDQSRLSMILVSRHFKDALTVFALNYFRLEVNLNNSFKVDGQEPTETFWLYRKEGVEYKRWHSVIDNAKLQQQEQEQEYQHQDTVSSSFSSQLGHNPIKRTSSSDSHQSTSSLRTSGDELPMAKISNLIQRNGSVKLVPPSIAERSVSAPFIGGLYNPFSNTFRGASKPFTRSSSFSSGTLASLKQFLSKTLPASPSPAYKMGIISQNGSEELTLGNNDSLDNIDSLPI